LREYEDTNKSPSLDIFGVFRVWKGRNVTGTLALNYCSMVLLYYCHFYYFHFCNFLIKINHQVPESINCSFQINKLYIELSLVIMRVSMKSIFRALAENMSNSIRTFYWIYAFFNKTPSYFISSSKVNKWVLKISLAPLSQNNSPTQFSIPTTLIDII
jgi:hypothetical protein